MAVHWQVVDMRGFSFRGTGLALQHPVFNLNKGQAMQIQVFTPLRIKTQAVRTYLTLLAVTVLALLVMP